MPADNVTPFRRPPRRAPAPQQSGGIGLKTHRGKVILVHVFTLLCFGLGYLIAFPLSDMVTLGFGVAAAVIAVVSRNDTTPWAATHHLQALHTLIIAMGLYMSLQLPFYLFTTESLAGFMATLAPVMLWGGIIISIWALIRAAVGLVLAILRRPVFNARGLLL